MNSLPFKIQMNQDGAILKIENSTLDRFNIIPDYIKLEKASYPRMTVNPVELWTEEDPPPEDYGKNIIDDTFEESWYYTFYCDTNRTSSNGNGSFEEPYTDFYTAIYKIKRFFRYVCCNIISIRLIVKGSIKLKESPYLAERFEGLNFIIDCSEAEFYHTTTDDSDDRHGTTIGVEYAYIYNLKISSISNTGQFPLYLYRLRVYNLTPEVGMSIEDCVVSKINKPLNDRDGNYTTIGIARSYIKNTNNSDFVCAFTIGWDFPSYTYISNCELNLNSVQGYVVVFDSNITHNSDYTIRNWYIYRSEMYCTSGCIELYNTYIYDSSLSSYLDLSDHSLESLVPDLYFTLANSYIFDSKIKNVVKLPPDPPNDSKYYMQKAVAASGYNKMSSIKNSSIDMEGTIINRPNDNCSCIGYGAVEYLSVRERNLFIVNCELSETVMSPLPDYCDWVVENCEGIWL